MTDDRSTRIGGGDISSILGVSPYKTALRLYYEKIGEMQEEVDEEKRLFFKRRKRQEPVVAEMLAEDNGYDVVRLSTDADPNRYPDPDVSYFAAEVDFELRSNWYLRRDHPVFERWPDGELFNGEIKTVHPLAAAEFGEDGTDIVPIYYAAQVMWGLGVTGRPAALLAAVIGFDDLRCYPIIRDDETIAWMRERAHDFWNNHVIPRVPPDPSTMDDCKMLFSRFAGRPCALDQEAFDALLRVGDLRAQIKACETAEDDAELQVALHIAKEWQANGPDDLGDNALLRFDGVDVGSWKLQTRTSLDSKRFRADHPDLFQEYSDTAAFRVLRLIKPKQSKSRSRSI